VLRKPPTFLHDSIGKGHNAEYSMLGIPSEDSGNIVPSQSSLPVATPSGPRRMPGWWCAFVGAGCVAAILEPAPGDEVLVCGAFIRYCSTPA
jgi:hypothetical protein